MVKRFKSAFWIQEVLVIALLIFCTQSVVATAWDSSGKPFITIDPIGDHVIGEVFFINGTTDLPITENLTMNIQTIYRHAQKNSPPFTYLEVEIKNIPVVAPFPEKQGVNHWSVNVTDNVKELIADQYCVAVWSSQNFSIGNGFICFSLLPKPNATPLTVLQMTLTSPSPVQPATITTTVLSTTQSSPLPLALPIAGIAAVVILIVIRMNKRD